MNNFQDRNPDGHRHSDTQKDNGGIEEGILGKMNIFLELQDMADIVMPDDDTDALTTVEEYSLVSRLKLKSKHYITVGII